MEDNSFTLVKTKSKRYPAKTITGVDYIQYQITKIKNSIEDKES